MKKYGLISVCACLLFAFPAATNAQETTEYFPQGTTWEEEYYHEGWEGNPADTYLDYKRHTVYEDTIIGEVTYKKVIVDVRAGLDGGAWDGYSDWRWVYDHFYVIREEDDKIYYRPYNAMSYHRDALKYDFSWEVGKQIPYKYSWGEDKYSYVAIDSIYRKQLQDGKEYEHCMIRWYSSTSPELYQIRGIGVVMAWYGIFEDYYAPMFDGCFQYHHLVNFTRNGELIYEWDRSEVTGIENAVTDRRTSSDDSVYSVTGVRMNTSGVQPLPRGVYIRGGKKFLVR